MRPFDERKLAYLIAGILLAVGAVCYAAFPVEAPKEPVRLMFQTVSGNVLFTHKDHASTARIGIECKECHHHPGEGETELLPCKACHRLPGEGDAVPAVCLDCHDQAEVEGAEIPKSSDAFHKQCIGCHQDFGGGPQECSSCHVL
jgi:hypothetical protein